MMAEQSSETADKRGTVLGSNIVFWSFAEMKKSSSNVWLSEHDQGKLSASVRGEEKLDFRPISATVC